MASSPSVLSETLQSITITKIHELEKQRESYSNRKNGILDLADDESKDVRDRVTALLNGLKSVPGFANSGTNKELQNMRRWVDQSVYDPAVPESKLLGFEDKLRDYLAKGSRKLDLAHLYSRLLTEWIQSPTSADSEPAELEKSESDESFEVVEDSQKARLEQLRDKFARVVFTPLETDEVEIDNYLKQLFAEDHGEKVLKRLQEDVSKYGKGMLEDSFRLDEQTLKWCIKALLKNELLSDEKKASLKDFLKDEAVLSEIKDVLNMRFRDIKDWEWNLGEEGMPVVPRQSLNGKWRVMMDEDVLQALLTHWIGTCWAVKIKNCFISTRRMSRHLWQSYTHIPDDESAKRQYYFDGYSFDCMMDHKSAANERQTVYENDFFMAPLPSKMFEEAGGYDDDDEVPESDRKSPKDIKQLLLRTLTTEVIMRRSLDGEVAVVQSDFQWFATGIAHTTIFAVMRFMGFPEEWITFFRKVLEPPLNMLDGNPVRTRKRGLPMAHVFEKLLGEVVLFFMDLAVAQNSGTILYRFHDDLWLAGSPKNCANAWKAMQDFAKIMGLEFNKNKTGSVYLTDDKHRKDSDVLKTLPEGPVAINFLVLDPDLGKWVINQEHVQEHVRQLAKQLAESKSVLQWIKTWNSCIGRFFSYTFGEPAHCFGLTHVNKILETHQHMQKFLFNDEDTGISVTRHVKHLLSTRFDVDDIPDAFVLMPESLGGLGLKNPFVPLLLLRPHVCKSPEARMSWFQKKEREEYSTAKQHFESLTEREMRKRYKAAFLSEDDEGIEPALTWENAQKFMSFEAFIAYRERTSQLLYQTYKYLLKQPEQDSAYGTHRVKYGLKELAYVPEGLNVGDGSNMSAETLWTVQFFEDELFEKFGGLEVVDKGLLPMGVLKALRSRKVTWQMVL